ncbi:MAG: hypothetical protein ACR5KX_06155 [Wolbachia sp.]
MTSHRITERILIFFIDIYIACRSYKQNKENVAVVQSQNVMVSYFIIPGTVQEGKYRKFLHFIALLNI